MTGTIAEDLVWLKNLIEEHVPCNCFFLALGRACRHKPWCLRTFHVQRLRFFRDSITFEFAMKGIAMTPPQGTRSTQSPGP
jgi:hypothetical protein